MNRSDFRSVSTQRQTQITKASLRQWPVAALDGIFVHAALLSLRHRADSLLVCVRPSVGVAAAVAVMAVVRVQLPSHQQLGVAVTP